MPEFAFSLNEQVKLVLSGEKGVVLGIAKYVETNPSFYVRFVAADGRQCEGWFSEQALVTNE